MISNNISYQILWYDIFILIKCEFASLCSSLSLKNTDFLRSFLCYLPQTHLGAAILAHVSYWSDKEVWWGEPHVSCRWTLWAGGDAVPTRAQLEPRRTQRWGSAGKGVSLSTLQFFSSLLNISCVLLHITHGMGL